MKYVWEIKSYWSKNRNYPSDYSVSGEYDSIEEALEFKEQYKKFSIKNNGLILEDKSDYYKVRYDDHDADMELKTIEENHKYKYQLDDGTWVEED